MLAGCEDCAVAAVGLAGAGPREQGSVPAQMTTSAAPVVALELKEPPVVTSRLSIAEDSTSKNKVQKMIVVMRSMVYNYFRPK